MKVGNPPMYPREWDALEGEAHLRGLQNVQDLLRILEEEEKKAKEKEEQWEEMDEKWWEEMEEEEDWEKLNL